MNITQMMLGREVCSWSCHDKLALGVQGKKSNELN